MFAIDEILATSDFFNIGTNDLTQFILAADRNALAMIDDYTVLHLSVLRTKKVPDDGKTNRALRLGQCVDVAGAR